MQAVTDRLDGATNVLLAEPSMGGSRDVCATMLAESVDEPNVLFVSFTQRASDCVERWDATGATARHVGVITVDEASTDIDRDGVQAESVSSPSDLTGLGIKIGQFLSEWDRPVVVCFDSLTSLLQYVDVETAYEFLHAITGQVHAAGARAHFHIDPSAHDEKTVAAITSLFDASVAVGDDVSVRTRDVIE